MAVYFVRQGVTGNVKIGYAADVTKRMSGLQVGQHLRLRLMRLFDGSLADEKNLHARFRHLAISGEWFRFHPDMMDDVGLPEIEMPKLGKYGKDNWPATPSAYERDLHTELLDIVGGENEFCRRSDCLPWEAVSYGHLSPASFGVLIALLRERGRFDITRKMLSDVHTAARRHSDGLAADRARGEAIRTEGYWIKRNPGVAPWWPVHPENESLLAQSLSAARSVSEAA